MANKIEVYSVAAMLYSPTFKNLENMCITSGIQQILSNPEDNMVYSAPEDYHVTISYIEFRKEDWADDIPARMHILVSSLLADKNITLLFKRLGILYKYFFAEYYMEDLIAFKHALLVAQQKEFPQGIFGFEVEYFPHITLARFNVPANMPRIIKRELIATQIRGQEIQQPTLVSPLVITSALELRIGIKLQESNFL